LSGGGGEPLPLSSPSFETFLRAPIPAPWILANRFILMGFGGIIAEATGGASSKFALALGEDLDSAEES
jgi:hypothetical protein